MNSLELVKSRRSIRKFDDHEVSDEMVELLIEAARWAPSAGNRQPWHFVVVRNKELRNRLALEAYGMNWLTAAPLIIVVCAVARRSAIYYGKRGRELYCIQDTAAAIQNMLLCAKDLGLGSCWVGAFDEAVCSQILNLPGKMRPVAMIPIGFAAREPSPPPGRPMEKIMEYRL